MRVTVAVPLFGVDVPVASRCNRWLAGFGESTDWDWDVAFVQGGWVSEAKWDAATGCRLAQGLRVIRATRPGRGRAVKDIWMSSGSEVLACVDSGLRTNVARLRTLLRPLREGEADLVVGARVAAPPSGFREWMLQGRGWLAEAMTRWATGSRLHDHRSGVVALTAPAVRGLVPHVRSTRDLFEMELLLLAQRLGWRILEIPLIPSAFSTVRPGVLREFARLLRDNGVHRRRREGGGGRRIGG